VNLRIEESNEVLTTHAGLAAIGHLLQKTQLRARLNATHLTDRPMPEISHGDVVASYVGLLCLGKNDFDHIEAHRKDIVFRAAVGVGVVPSSPTLRQRLDLAAGQAGWEAILREESAKLLAGLRPPLTAVVAGGRTLLPLDIDVSPWDNSGTKKEGVSRTYHGYDGYAPIFGFLGVEGYAVHAQLRPGKDHSQKGTPEFLRESIGYARAITDQQLLVRLDSGFDSRENIRLCGDLGVEFVIKRNLRGESEQAWLKWAQDHAVATEPRPGKRIWRGVLEGGHRGPARMVVEVVERTIRADGQLLLVPEVEVQAWWTSLPEDPDTVIRLYQEHGTMEQFHSEFKTDLDLERLPSGHLATNNLVLQCALLAYNMLRLMGQALLGDRAIPLRSARQRRRIRTVMQNLVYLAARMVAHGRRIWLRYGRGNVWGPSLQRVYEAYA